MRCEIGFACEDVAERRDGNVQIRSSLGIISRRSAAGDDGRQRIPVRTLANATRLKLLALLTCATAREMVSLTFANENRIGEWRRQLAALGTAA